MWHGSLSSQSVIVSGNFGVGGDFSPTIDQIAIPDFGYYASPSGSGSTCTEESPCTIATALGGSSPAGAGDTIWLRDGTYGTGGGYTVTSTVSGASGNTLKVRRYPGETPMVDGTIDHSGSYVEFRDFQIRNSSATRTGTVNDRGPGIDLDASGTGNRVIRVFFRDTGHPGIGYWSQESNSALYGNIIRAVGLSMDTDLGVPRGSGIYAQNQTGNPEVYNNISYWNITRGGKAYAEGGYVNGFRWHDNTAFSNGPGEHDIFLANNGPNDGTDNQIYDNRTYDDLSASRGGLRVGYGNNDMNDVSITGNYVVSGHFGTGGIFMPNRIATLTFTGNTVVSGHSIGRIVNYVAHASPTETWNNNTYHALYSTPFRIEGDSEYNFTNWKSTTGFDAGSSFTGSVPSTNVVFVTATEEFSDQYGGDDTGFVTVYNWESSSSVSVAVTFLESGDSYSIRDVQCFVDCGVIASGTYNGSSLSIPLTNSNADSVAGLSRSHTALDFGVFTVNRSP